MASEARKALSMAERHRAVVDKAPELLAELDTEHKAACRSQNVKNAGVANASEPAASTKRKPRGSQ